MPRTSTNHPLIESFTIGFLGGLAGTVPMTLFMRGAHRRLPRHERYALPPELITHRLVKPLGASAHPEKPGWDLKTYAGHFAYGAGCGGTYAAVAPRGTDAPRAMLHGALFGVGVWAASYLGWLPAAGILPPATRTPARRNAVMIIAHLIWGATTALAVERLWAINGNARPQIAKTTRPGSRRVRG